MYNWTVDTTLLKQFHAKYQIWKLEQLINFGLRNEKIDKTFLKANINKLKLDPSKKRFIKFILKNDKKSKNPIK